MTEPVKPDFVSVVREEHGWSDEMLKRAGGHIYAVYVFDRTRETCVCEISPSYWMRWIDSFPHTLPDDDHEREQLLEDIMEAGSSCDDDTYMPCREYNGIKQIESDPDDVEEYLNETGEDEKEELYRKLEDAAVEAVSANSLYDDSWIKL